MGSKRKALRERERPLLGSLTEVGLSGIADLPEPLAVPLLLVMALVLAMAWLQRWVIDEMISRG